MTGGRWPRPPVAVDRARRALPGALRDILDFWFGAPIAPGYGERRKAWFEKDDAFDRTIRDRFARVHADIAAGAWDDRIDDPDAALALIVALDQFPRNMYRGTAAMYASDERARSFARGAVARGHDRVMVPVERWFVYLPFEHSEDLADQDRSVGLFRSIPEHEQGDLAVDSAVRHRAIVARFGRFPHRNAILGRATTEAEEAFLREPGSSF